MEMLKKNIEWEKKIEYVYKLKKGEVIYFYRLYT